jgi:hypothetical protein
MLNEKEGRFFQIDEASRFVFGDIFEMVLEIG